MFLKEKKMQHFAMHYLLAMSNKECVYGYKYLLTAFGNMYHGVFSGFIMT